MPNMALELAKQWMEKAEHDLVTARAVLALPDGPTDTPCFHVLLQPELLQHSRYSHLSAMHGGLFGGFKSNREFPLTHRVVFAHAPILYIPPRTSRFFSPKTPESSASLMIRAKFRINLFGLDIKPISLYLY